MLTDSPNLRRILSGIFSHPKIRILDVAPTSGQRVVYFCEFEPRKISPGTEEGSWIPDGRTDSWGKVVVKISEGISPESIAYLQKEIEILKSLDSKHYPTLLFQEVYSQDPDSEMPFLNRLYVTIETYIESTSLRECMGRFSDEAGIILLIERLVDALSVLWNHPKKLVHRDIKPENILIKPGGELAIIDLGIAREEGATGITNTFNPWGPCTFLYASPEQAKNDKRNISFRSDLFSIGTLAYELATGTNPFKAQTGQEVLNRIVTHDPPPLKSILAYSHEFSELIGKFMSKQPYMRFRRVQDVVDQIKKLKSMTLLL